MAPSWRGFDAPKGSGTGKRSAFTAHEAARGTILGIRVGAGCVSHPSDPADRPVPSQGACHSRCGRRQWSFPYGGDERLGRRSQHHLPLRGAGLFRRPQPIPLGRLLSFERFIHRRRAASSRKNVSNSRSLARRTGPAPCGPAPALRRRLAERMVGAIPSPDSVTEPIARILGADRRNAVL
jgi:hypothetical protein